MVGQEQDGTERVNVVMRCWFAGVFRFGLAEQARRLMHPDLPKKEEELAEHGRARCEGWR